MDAEEILRRLKDNQERLVMLSGKVDADDSGDTIQLASGASLDRSPRANW